MTARRPYDAIVVGVGTMGSAALFHLARRGLRVLGIEQFAVAHARGSMHGHSRIIRLAYHEHPGYVPLLRRCYELWRELGGLAGTQLLHLTGSLEIGPPAGPLVNGTLRACTEFDLPCAVLEPTELRRRFPAFEPPPDTIGVAQPDGGYLLAEAAVQAHAGLAVEAGAELRLGERVLDWDAGERGVIVHTDRASHEAARLVLAPGAWAGGLLRLPPRLFASERQVVAWFEPRDGAALTADRLPVFIVEEDGTHYYGLPRIGGAGVKLGRMNHPGDPVANPDVAGAEPSPAEVAPLRSFLERRLPNAPGRLLEARACLFTNTLDRRFVIDLHPDEPNVVVASVCSGHGFKFAPVVGEILADLAESGETKHPIGFLRYGRFATGPSSGPRSGT
jgi:sarcosine oxidase